MTTNRICIGLVTSLILASEAVAQTGPVREANIDVDGTMTVVAMVLLPVLAAIVLALFEPWKWFGRNRKVEKRPRRRRRRD